jgi:hypothetical protein
MRKNYLNESIEEDVETTPQTQKVGFDEFNRFCLQLTEEEQDTLSFKEIMAKLLDVEPDAISSIRKSGLGWALEVENDESDDMEDWEREGYRSEIAYDNRWRDYRDDEDDDEGDDEEEDRDPYSPWNRDY